MKNIGDHINDAHVIVREAMVEMLINIRESNAMDYAEICPYNKIVEQLAKETFVSVRLRITELVFPKFIGTAATKGEKLRRALTFLEANPK